MEHIKVYAAEMEKKLNYLQGENEKLKSILLERCKNTW